MSDSKVYLYVPFAEKEEAKALGGQWDKGEKRWFCYKRDERKFTKWATEKTKVYIKCTFDQKDKIKALGAQWDKKAKRWYCYEEDRSKYGSFRTFTGRPFSVTMD